MVLLLLTRHSVRRLIQAWLDISRADLWHPLDIRDANDAHVVLEAVRLNILPLIRRRLTSGERDQLKTGNVFVWEEAEDDGGLLRWTDGRRWWVSSSLNGIIVLLLMIFIRSQSRMRGDYLFYEEKVETTQEEKDAKAARRCVFLWSIVFLSDRHDISASRASDPSAIIPTATRRKDRPSKPNGLTKQTYSAVVHLPGSRSPRKWHVVAYFSVHSFVFCLYCPLSSVFVVQGNDYTRLPVIENYDYLRNIHVPIGVFASSKAGARMDRFSYYPEIPYGADNDASYYEGHSNARSPRFSENRPLSSSSSSSSATTSTQNHRQSVSPPPRLPPLSNLDYPDRRPPMPHRRTAPPIQSSRPPSTAYTPLSAEDRRVLNSFRVVLWSLRDTYKR